MTFPCLLLGLALIGGKILPPDSIVPPDDGAAARYYEQIGLALASWGADQAAVRNFEQALKRDPQRLTTRLALARSMASLGLGLPAVQQVELVMKADPRNLAAQRLYGKLMLYGGQVPQARKILGGVVKQAPDDPEALRLLGLCLLTQKDLPGAEKVLRQALKADPLDAEAQQALGRVLLAAERTSEAMRALHRYLDLRPDDVETTIVLAELYATHGRNRDALALGLRLVELAPAEPRPLMGVATMLVRLGRRDEAEQFFRRALALSSQPELVLAASEFLADRAASRGRFAEAADYTRRVVALRPELLPPRLALVKFCALAHRWREAAAATRALVALHPDHLGFRMQWFDYSLRAGDLSTAAEAARQTAARWSDRPEVTEQLAQGFLLAGRPEQGIALVERLRRGRPAARSLTWLLYQLYRGAGRDKLALALMREANRRYPDDPVPRHELAALAYREHDWQRVVDLLQPLAQRRQLAPDAVFALAWANEKIDRYGDAAMLYELLAAARNEPLGMLNVARQYEHLEDYATAVAIYRRVLRLRPGHVPTQLALGRALGNAGELPAAAEMFAAVVKAQPDNALGLRSYALALHGLGRLDEAEQVYRKLAAADPDNAYAVAEVGDLQAERQMVDQAVETWLAGLRRRPGAAVLHRRLAEAYSARKQYPEAIAHYTKAAERDAQDGPTRFALASLSERTGLFGEARRWYRELIDLGPESRYLYRRWLQTFAAEGQAELGVETGLQLLTLRPGSDLLAEAVVEQATRGGLLATLESRVAHLLRTRSHQSALSDAYGLALAESGQSDQARQWYQDLSRQAPLESLWLRRLGGVLEDSGQGDQARSTYEQAVRRQPRDPAALRDLARAQAATGRTTEAMLSARRLITLDPRDDAGFERLVRLYAAQGKVDQARAGLESLLAEAGRPGREQYFKNPALIAAYGLANELSGRVAAARDAYQRALAIDTHNGLAAAGLRRLEQATLPLGSAFTREAPAPPDPFSRAPSATGARAAP